MKTALVLEGGGLRGVFTAGAVDYFIDKGIEFDYVCGVSAGACNTFEYIGKEKGFMRKCILENEGDPFYGVGEFIETKHFVNLDKVFNDYADKFGYDFDRFLSSSTRWEMVVSNMQTGQAEYMHSDDLDRVKLIGKASCSLPLLTSPAEIDGQHYMDGGITDSIPLQHALDLGYDRIVVVLTRKKGNYSIVSKPTLAMMKQVYEEYPNFIEASARRTQMYHEEVDLCEKLEEEGKVLLIRPTMQEVGRLESNKDELSLSYYHGYTKAREMMKKW